MAKHDTNSIQVVLEVCPRFDSKDEAHVSENKDDASLHRQRIASIFQGNPKPTAVHSLIAVATWTRANENLFSILFFPRKRSTNNIVKIRMGRPGRMGSVTGKRRGMPYKISTIVAQRRLEIVPRTVIQHQDEVR